LIFSFAALCFLLENSSAQSNMNPALKVQEKVYSLAMENGDLEAATMAVYQLMALQPERIDWQDTLCLLYHGRGFYMQSALIASKILKRNPDNQPITEVLAQAYENIGNYQEAMLLYDKLLKKQRNPVFIYKRALMQYSLRYFTECEKGILEILKDEASDNLQIATQTDLSSSKMNMVPLKAATLNILGVMYMEMNLNEKAKDAFLQALDIHADYPLVRANLQKLEEGSGSK
jgi:tetratricopeptide (TPR) repeat protein